MQYHAIRIGKKSGASLLCLDIQVTGRDRLRTLSLQECRLFLSLQRLCCKILECLLCGKYMYVCMYQACHISNCHTHTDTHRHKHTHTHTLSEASRSRSKALCVRTVALCCKRAYSRRLSTSGPDDVSLAGILKGMKKKATKSVRGP